MADAPRVYVLLLNWQGWKDTIECLESVFQLDYPRLQVVVCDNASPNGSLDFVRSWAAGELSVEGVSANPLRDRGRAGVERPIAWVEMDRETAERGGPAGARDVPLALIQVGENLGFAGGNNVGIRYALAEREPSYVWLLNNDTVVDRDALRRLVETAERDRSIGMVGSKLLDYREPDVIQAVAGGVVSPWRGLTRHIGERERDRDQWATPFEPDYITGASLLVRAEAARAIGALDERYFLYSEEVDWCLRARQQGWRLMYCPGSTVWHKGGSSVGHHSAFHDYHTVRSTLMWVRKFYPRRLPVVFLYTLYRCLAPKVVRMQGPRLRAVVRAYRDFFLGRPQDAGVRAGH